VLNPSSNDQKEKNTIDFSELPVFDPNDLSLADWMDLGLSEKQANSVINFKEKIGGYKDLKTFKKAYGISDQFYARIASKITFKSTENQIKNVQERLPANKEKNFIDSSTINNSHQEFRSKKIDKVEINSATYDDLIQINGIGNFFAEQIIDLRIKRGGLTDLQQLLEIPYLDQEKLDRIKPDLALDPTKVVKMNLNKVTLKQLSRHPDMTWDMARSIIDLRADLGSFESLDQILLSAHIDLRRFNHLKKYLTIE
jgi:DNA uptake protein ComE-like DNA-binding protein